MRRKVLTGLSVVVAAGVGVVTNVFTDRWQWPWGVGLVALVGLLTAVHLAFPASDDSPLDSGGPGSVTVSGDRSVGFVSGGTVVTGDGNVVSQQLAREGRAIDPKGPRR